MATPTPLQAAAALKALVYSAPPEAPRCRKMMKTPSSYSQPVTNTDLLKQKQAQALAQTTRLPIAPPLTPSEIAFVRAEIPCLTSGSAQFVDTDSSYISIPADSSFSFNRAEEFTIEWWQFMSGVTKAKNPMIFAYGSIFNTYAEYIFLGFRESLDLPSGRRKFAFIYNNIEWEFGSLPRHMIENNWVHFAIVRKCVPTSPYDMYLTLYINGQSINDSTGMNNPIDPQTGQIYSGATGTQYNTAQFGSANSYVALKTNPDSSLGINTALAQTQLRTVDSRSGTDIAVSSAAPLPNPYTTTGFDVFSIGSDVPGNMFWLDPNNVPVMASVRPITTGSSPELYYDTGFSGFITNFRIVRGNAVYRDNFATSANALERIPGTILLLSFNNEETLEKDYSSYGKAITFKNVIFSKNTIILPNDPTKKFYCV